MIAPRTLFGRTALVIALVSFAFQMFTIAVITYFALVPLGRHATNDLAALMVDTAESWETEPVAERVWLQERISRVHRLQVQDPPGEAVDFTRQLPYFQLLESALSVRAGERIELRTSRAEDGEQWYWADLPAAGAKVRVGFPASRVDVQPWLAMLLILSVGTVVTLITSTWLARWLIAPLSRLSAATQHIGKGQRGEPLPETGPTELATLAREFNRMGEQVEELLTNRTTLLAGISHDLRTPLARIQLALGMISERFDQELLEHVLRDVEGMNQLIARCLEVSRDFVEKESVELDLCDLLAEVAMEFSRRGAEIRGHKGPDCHLRVRPLALKRILSNLVDNAQRYGEGQIIDIEYHMADHIVEICVLDRGPGIAEEEREKVFQPFYRLEPSRSSRTGGSGLGLAIVRQLATANGWTVELAARPGGGTAACVRVPLEDTQGLGAIPASLR
ncbi:MAG: Osmolarity sensor protein EnvZ [Rhodocyclaceae bacterium]|nr:MAG: Osmolarity sensor protein EnvZ [Rhodocyclaceae bacterium]TNC99937.1 MAG: Osmolarity sensor protein EnvZ [Rhodocyclaceae bacterium]